MKEIDNWTSEREITSKRTRWLEDLERMGGRSMVRRCSWEIQVAREGREDPGKKYSTMWVMALGTRSENAEGLVSENWAAIVREAKILSRL